MRLLLTIIILLSFSASPAQIVDMKYFSDTTGGRRIDYVFDHHKAEDGIILSGFQRSGNIELPLILKLNLYGEVVWSTLNTVQSGMLTCLGFSFEVSDDGYIYGVSTETSSYPTMSKKLWKVDASSGDVLWIKPLETKYFTRVEIADYDTLRFLVAYQTSQMVTKIAWIDKKSGDTLGTKSFGSCQTYNLASDQNKNVYFAQDSSLIKYNRDNLEMIIWKYTYRRGSLRLDELHELYLDQYDDVYLFGRDGGSFGHGNGIISRINSSTGSEEWVIAVGFTASAISDFVESADTLYTTHRHTLVGSGNYRFFTAKVDKSSGTTYWTKAHDVAPVGSTSSTSGGGQAALSVDVDCRGDVYLTGYYGDANYGPEQWGTMKLQGSNGNKLYDFTITEDSSYYDDVSTGLAVYLFGNSPVLIGHVEDTLTGLEKPLYVTFQPSNGKIISKKTFAAKFHTDSRTLDIVNYRNEIYTFKQAGRDLHVEKYTADQTLLWKTKIAQPQILRGGQIAVAGNSLFLTAYTLKDDTLPPYFSNITDRLLMYRLNTANGAMLQSTGVNYGSSRVKPFELEADSANAYIFYNQDDTIYYRKWNGAVLSSAFYFEPAGAGSLWENSSIVLNDSPDTLLVAGSSAIYNINKTSLGKSLWMNYPGTAVYYDMIKTDSILYLGGSTLLKEQTLLAVNKHTQSVLWSKKYLPGGAICKINIDNAGNLYCLGSSDSVISVSRLTGSGNPSWNYKVDTVKTPFSVPMDMIINEDDSSLCISGAGIRNNTTDAVIELLSLNGDTLFTTKIVDELGEKSQANCIAILPDSSYWVGGAHNRISYGKQGFIYTLLNPFGAKCASSSTINLTECKKLLSPSGKYSWTVSGIYKDTIPNAKGCDSIITVNLTVIKPDTSVSLAGIVLTSNAIGASYQWLDCSKSYQPVPGAVSRVFTPGISGSYAVEVSQGLCRDTSSCFSIVITTIQENSTMKWELYPNPTEGIIYFRGMNGEVTCTISDLLGNTIKKTVNSATNPLEIKEFKNGVYLLQVEQGGNCKHFRIVKSE
jgi:hypothetical protein